MTKVTVTALHYGQTWTRRFWFAPLARLYARKFAVVPEAYSVTIHEG